MADKAITDLNTIPGSVDDNNTWFAVAQSGTAYKVSGHEFTLALGTILDGHGGVKSIVYTPPTPPSLTGTMVVTLADNTTTTVNVENGKGISSIAKTSTAGLVDTYTITYNDSTTSTFSVTNGAKGDTGDSWYVWIRYAGSMPTSDADMGTTPDDWIGIYSGTEDDPSNLHYTDFDWFEYKGEKGDTGTASAITTQTIGYQASNSGTVVPSGSWTTTIPVVPPGNYLWTRTQLAFNDGSVVTAYSVSRFGIDGTGAVSTVNSISPDGSGNVALTADDIPLTNNVSVEDTIDQIETDMGDVSNLTTAATNCVGAINELKTSIKYMLTSTGNSTDRSSEILAKLNAYGVCYLADGEFYISSGVSMPDNTSIFGVGAGTKVILADNATSQYVFNVGSYCTVSDLTIIGNSTPLPYSSYTQGNRKAIQLIGDYSSFDSGTYSHNFAKLSNLTIQDFNHSGIWAYKNDGAASFLATNIDILRCHTGINIELFSEFHSFSNIRCRWCNIACVMQGGNNLFSNCHFDTNLMGIKVDGTNNTLVNADHSSFSNCTVCHPNNNTGYSVWLSRSMNSLLFSNCQFWYGQIYIDTCSGVKFDHNIIGGSNSDVTMLSSNKVTFTNNLFKTASPSVTITSCSKIIFENNQDDNGNLIFNAASRGSVSNLQASVIQSGNYSNLSFQNIGYCQTAGKFEVVIPLPFMINTGNASYSLNRIVLLGKGTVPTADLSNVTVTFEPTYLRVSNIPWTGATVGSVCIIDVRGDLTFS